MRAIEDVEVRFMRHVSIDPETNCWLWQLSKCEGYGRFSVRGKDYRAHKWAFEHWVGPVPEGLQLDHFKCDNPSCANPEHVRPTTPRENLLRSNAPTAWHAAKTHCPQGHPYAGPNLIQTARRRRCLTCQRAADHRKRAQRSAQRTALRWSQRQRDAAVRVLGPDSPQCRECRCSFKTTQALAAHRKWRHDAAKALPVPESLFAGEPA